MKEITEKLHNKAMADFLPVIEQMAREGCDKNQIVGAYQKHLQSKIHRYYAKQHEPKLWKYCFDVEDLKRADSKAEMVFYDLLREAHIKFTFQNVIGPYRVDYLVMGFLVIEIDGPQHDVKHDNKRDAYLRKMGYKIIRIPIWILASCPEAAIDEIRAAVGGSP